MLTNRIFAASITCATLLAVSSLAQDNPQPAQSESIDISGIPAPRGIYYRSNGGWVALSPNVWMPLWDERPIALQVLNVGYDHTVTQLPGRHAGIQIANDARPTFYLHGISPADLFLVRAETKNAYRETRMKANWYFWDWVRFQEKDVVDFGIEGVNGDIIAIRPTTELKPGEYTIASTIGRDYEWIRLGFDFGILGTVPRQ